MTSRALLDFKNSFTIYSGASYYYCSSSSYPRTNSWHEGQDCCYWDGVTCDTTTGQVIGLELSCSCLLGQLSSNNSLFLLKHLQILNLAYNDFNGSKIPPMMSQFRRLTRLNLSHSNFYGEVPIQMSYLSNLVSLDLSSDLEFGELTLPTVPRLTMKSLVQNLTMLKELKLDVPTMEPDSLRNISSTLTSLILSRLNGIFPTSIFHLPNLQLLYLSGDYNGDLQVSLPSYNWSTTSLTDLRFIFVNLENGLPSSIGNLKSLRYMSINIVHSGSIPDSIGNLTRLVHLDLSKSYFPSDHLQKHYLVGKIPPSLACLTNLEYLDLSNNELVGSLPNFSNLSLLHTVSLFGNSLNGTVPFSMYSLPLLRTLDLTDNQFTGGQLHPFQSRLLETINLRNCSLQGSIPTILFPHGANQLVSLELGNNGLNGTIPSSLFTLPSLIYLHLSYNQLVGAISEFGASSEFKSTSLKEIYLSNNKLQGNIPSSISSLTNLTTLSFSSNNLSGTINTSMLSKLQSLNDLDGSNNNLSFPTNRNLNHTLPNLEKFVFSSNNLRDFPVILRGSKVLFHLDLSNNKIDGHVPDWLFDVGRDTLEYLNLAHNSLTRIYKLPWKNLQNIDFRSNLFRGSLPLIPRTLRSYLISNNSLMGDIPTLICNTNSVEILDLSRNNFSGTIPECLGKIYTLTVLDLSMNKFHGRIPNFCGHEKTSLTTLNLNGNQLEGKLPISLVNCTNLEVLDIGSNTINDTFPRWLRFITKLQVLVLKSNNFHGYIHDYKYQHNFQKLTIFDISNNDFVGSLPTKYIQGLEAMKQDMLVGTDDSIYMGSELGVVGRSFNFGGVDVDYDDSISLTIKGNENKFEKILTTFTTIDFSKNNFKGEIPQVFGTLISLKSLNLSHNNLFGHIPSSIGKLRNLESLDLSSNKLEGTIPTALARLTSLEVLNLSQNALVGPIPSTNNFNTHFDNNSYQENLALCGPPLSRKCVPEKPPPLILHEVDDSNDDDFDRKIILYGYVSGLVIGLSIGYIVLSGELPIWLAKMVQRYRIRKLQGQTKQRGGRN